MFYSEAILAKKGTLAKVWLAAHWDRRLTRTQIHSTNIQSSVDDIILHQDSNNPMALRLSGQLLLGVVKIYSRKARYLLDDCNEALMKIKLAFRPGIVEFNEHEIIANYNSITIHSNMQFAISLDGLSRWKDDSSSCCSLDVDRTPSSVSKDHGRLVSSAEKQSSLHLTQDLDQITLKQDLFGYRQSLGSFSKNIADDFLAGAGVADSTQFQFNFNDDDNDDYLIPNNNNDKSVEVEMGRRASINADEANISLVDVEQSPKLSRNRDSMVLEDEDQDSSQLLDISRQSIGPRLSMDNQFERPDDTLGLEVIVAPNENLTVDISPVAMAVKRSIQKASAANQARKRVKRDAPLLASRSKYPKDSQTELEEWVFQPSLQSQEKKGLFFNSHSSYTKVDRNYMFSSVEMISSFAQVFNVLLPPLKISHQLEPKEPPFMKKDPSSVLGELSYHEQTPSEQTILKSDGNIVGQGGVETAAFQQDDVFFEPLPPPTQEDTFVSSSLDMIDDPSYLRPSIANQTILSPLALSKQSQVSVDIFESTQETNDREAEEKKQVELKIIQILNQKFQHAEEISFDELTRGATRSDAANLFFEVLVLQSRGQLCVEQEKAYEDVTIRKTSTLLEISGN